VWLIKCFSFFLTHPKAPTRPSTPKVLQVRECVPNSLLFRCFHFILTFESIKELGNVSQVYGFHKIIWSSHRSKWFCYRWVLIQDGHLITFENKKFYGAQLRWLTNEKEFYIAWKCGNTIWGCMKPKSLQMSLWDILKPNQGHQRSSSNNMIPRHCWTWSWSTNKVKKMWSPMH
jgi:hypothetical protein